MSTASSKNNLILVDGRWNGPYGIGRFSNEIVSRLHHADILIRGPRPLSLKNILWQPYRLYHAKNKYKVFFTPGFTPIHCSSIPFIITICDLIYLFAPGRHRMAKKIFFETLVKSSVKKAQKIITISDYSKKTIMEWATIPAENIVNVSCGISTIFSPIGIKHAPGYPYFLHVGNTQAHKNIPRLLTAFANAKIDPAIKLILTGKCTLELATIIDKKKLHSRVVFSGTLSDELLAQHYRGALALLFPSLYEGFGLPILEAMASGIPVLTSNVTSLPEVAGDAAIIVTPTEIDAITTGIEKILDSSMKIKLIAKGAQRVREFSWARTATAVQIILNEVCDHL